MKPKRIAVKHKNGKSALTVSPVEREFWSSQRRTLPRRYALFAIHRFIALNQPIK
jgi:hypothetical protein